MSTKKERKENDRFFAAFADYLADTMRDTKIPALYVSESEFNEFAKMAHTLTHKEMRRLSDYAADCGILFYGIEPITPDTQDDSADPPILNQEAKYVFLLMDPELNITMEDGLLVSKSAELWARVLNDQADSEDEAANDQVAAE